MAGRTLTLWLGLAGSLAIGCVAEPVARRDEDPLDAGVADAVMVAPVLDAVLDASASDTLPDAAPECVVEVNDMTNGGIRNRCPLYEHNPRSTCEQFMKCDCIGRVAASGQIRIGDLIGCIAGFLGEYSPRLVDSGACDGERSMSEVASVYRTQMTTYTAIGAGCADLLLSLERTEPWPMPRDDHCRVTFRDRGTSVARSCPISEDGFSGTCIQVAHCACAWALELPVSAREQMYRYYNCHGWALADQTGGLRLGRLCNSRQANVGELTGPLRYFWPEATVDFDLQTSPGCAEVPLDPTAGAATPQRLAPALSPESR